MIVPTIAVDDLFVTKSGIKSKHEITEEEVEDMSVLKGFAVRDVNSKALASNAAPGEGIDSNRYSESCVVRFVEWLVYSRVVL